MTREFTPEIRAAMVYFIETSTRPGIREIVRNNDPAAAMTRDEWAAMADGLARFVMSADMKKAGPEEIECFAVEVKRVLLDEVDKHKREERG